MGRIHRDRGNLRQAIVSTTISIPCHALTINTHTAGTKVSGGLASTRVCSPYSFSLSLYTPHLMRISKIQQHHDLIEFPAACSCAICSFLLRCACPSD